jgi:hypothetical protein
VKVSTLEEAASKSVCWAGAEVGWQPLPEDCPEAAFMERVVALARQHGWLVYHTLDSRGSDPGFPDLVLVRAGILFFVELKTDTGKETAEQKLWGDTLAEVKLTRAAIWRPCTMDAIERILTKPVEE